jgi:hypothetical protein
MVTSLSYPTAASIKPSPSAYPVLSLDYFRGHEFYLWFVTYLSFTAFTNCSLRGQVLISVLYLWRRLCNFLSTLLLATFVCIDFRTSLRASDVRKLTAQNNMLSARKSFIAN